MPKKPNRRELKSRQTRLAQKIARYLSTRRITPNQISIASVVFATGAAYCLVILPLIQSTMHWILPIVAALLIQLRLLCNLLDGMVAVEGGKGTPAGELFNDIPDRLADVVLFVSLGYASLPFNGHASTLGWCTALLAVLTAYVRVLASSIGAPADFCGPMAKQHRMFLLTIACLLTVLEVPMHIKTGTFLFYTLVIIGAGSLVTSVIRACKAYRYLENGNA